MGLEGGGALTCRSLMSSLQSLVKKVQTAAAAWKDRGGEGWEGWGGAAFTLQDGNVRR